MANILQESGNNKVMLIILDGWGNGKQYEGNAIFLAKTPFIDSLTAYPHAQLLTHGKNVGLPEGQMGNSEVGHINIGAGRIVYQELQRINNAIESNELENNAVFHQLVDDAKVAGRTVHVIGLVSDGGVHSHINHFKGILKLLAKQNVKNIAIHAFTDGRDTDPNEGINYLSDLEQVAQENNAEIVSVIGRYYAMDRDKRWERTRQAYDLLTNGIGQPTKSIFDSVQASYEKDITDEFIKPIVKVNDNGQPKSIIKDDDVVLFVNFRTDRPRQLTMALSQQEFPEHQMKPLSVHFYAMTNYDNTYKDIKVLFNKNDVQKTLGEIVSKNDLTQVRIAETEKYPHVTFFFNGGREVEFIGEKRIMINSPKVATYDLQPEMSALEVTSSILKEMNENQPNFICLNFANADMVGHTGIVEASIKACETVDNCVKRIVDLGLEQDYQFLITADHGNSDYMINDDGSPNTAHTTNPVPLYYVANNVENKTLHNGILADLAPTILSLLNIEIPEEMTGKILIEQKANVIN